MNQSSSRMLEQCSPDELRAEVIALRQQLDRTRERTEELENTIEAIQGGRVDAVVVHSEGTPEVWTLEQANRLHLNLTEQTANIGTWDWDIATGAVTWSKSLLHSFGLTSSGPPSFDALIALIHPADRERVQRRIAEAFEKENEFYEEFRVFRCNSDIRWIAARGQVVRGFRRKPQRLVGISIDITERRQREEELRQADQRKNEFLEALRTSEQRLRLALAAARMGIWTLDVETGVQLRDANLNGLIGLEAVETTQPFEEFLTHLFPADVPTVQAAFAASIRDRQPLNVEFRIVRPDGKVRWLRDQGDVFGESDAQFRHMAGACVDITERREAEEALRTSEERQRLIVESATNFAIFSLGPDRTVQSWGPGAQALFGFDAEDIVGQSGDVIFTPEDRAVEVPAKEAQQAVVSGRAEDERWHMRKDGTRFWASGVMNPLRDGGGFVKVLRDLTERKRMEDALREARDRLEERVAERTAELKRTMDTLESEMGRRRQLARRLATAQEDERRRASRDLHDSLGQLMAGLSLAFKAIETSSDHPPVTVSRLAEAQQIMKDLGHELHSLAVRLRPTSLDDIGLEAALGQLVLEWSSRLGVSVDFHAGLRDRRLPAEVETTVYRVVQEALTNIAKHANATEVGVAVTHLGEAVSVVVEDDGAGFDPAALPKGRLGLFGMRERVELVDGEIDVESGVGSGTTIIIQIPLTAKGSAS